MSAQVGFFDAAYELRNQPNVDQRSLDKLEDILSWFRQNLAVPSRFNISKSKGFYRRTPTRGLSWFKPTAKDHLARAYDLAALLGLHGYLIEIVKSARPGYVVYEDEHQLVAEPFADTVGRSNRAASAKD